MSLINLNDGTCAGMLHPGLKAMTVQSHPEASPGPHDSDVAFEQVGGGLGAAPPVLWVAGWGLGLLYCARRAGGWASCTAREGHLAGLVASHSCCTALSLCVPCGRLQLLWGEGNTAAASQSTRHLPANWALALS